MNVKRGVVWSDPRSELEGHGMESNNEPANKITKDIANNIANILVPYGSTNIVSKLIQHAILEQVKQYIREYDNVAAEDILRSLKDGWKLGEIKKWKAKVDVDYARHAKLSSFGDELTTEFKRIKKFNDPKELIEKIWAIKPTLVLDTGDGDVNVKDVIDVILEHYKVPVDADIGITEETTDKAEYREQGTYIKEHDMSKVLPNDEVTEDGL